MDYRALMVPILEWGTTVWVEPVVLEGEGVRLEPVGEQHVEGLAKAAAYPDLWRFMPYVVESEQQIRDMIAHASQLADQGAGLAFATRVKGADEIVGSTGFWNIEPSHRRLEIGFTWITPDWQRSLVNTECKYLMLQHAFETLACIRVEFKIDSLNERSRTALARIGAVEEGTLRNHMVQPDGRFRHSVYFSVLQEEWPRVKGHLEGLLCY